MSQVFTSSTIPLSFDPHEARAEGVISDSGPAAERQPPLWHCVVAGGLGGVVGDTLMHSLDTVKTRQQGFSHNLKYRHMIPAYGTILKEEGFFRGLYGGYSPAVLGSFPSTAAFFGTYEYTKRALIGDWGMNDTMAYFIAGVLGDLALSVFYVPSEVLKTRLQLQGRYNNIYTRGSGYNYRNLRDAISTITRSEGPQTFVFGYKETLIRDLPFSALQFAFYEKFRAWAIGYQRTEDLPVTLELLTGAAAGGLAGTLTTPMDVIKTRIQTQTAQPMHTTPVTSIWDRSSTVRALRSIYRTEGVLGAFSGVGPRCIWTAVQSSIMLLLYQVSLKQLESYVGTGME